VAFLKSAVQDASMPPVNFECIVPDALPTSLPLRLKQSSPLSSSLIKLILFLPVVAALLMPFGLLAVHAAAEPATRTALIASPGTTVRIIVSLALWAALFGWPVMRLLDGLVRAREVMIAGDVVVTERSLAGTRTWRTPLSEFSGLAMGLAA
jgi:hypothetical protein